jgi:uncharacterized membrane protein
MNNTLVSRIAILVYSLVLIVFGLGHFANASKMAGMVPSFLPGGVIWIYLSGAALLLAAIAFIINKQVRLAGYLLGVLLLIFVLTIHLPGMMNAKDEMMKMGSMGNLLKDLAIAAAAFYIGSKNE